MAVQPAVSNISVSKNFFERIGVHTAVPSFSLNFIFREAVPLTISFYPFSARNVTVFRYKLITVLPFFFAAKLQAC